MSRKPKKHPLPRRAPRMSVPVDIPREEGGFSIVEFGGRHIRALLGFGLISSSIIVFVVEKLKMKVVSFSREDLYMHVALIVSGWALLDWTSFREFAAMFLAKIPWGAAQKASSKLISRGGE